MVPASEFLSRLLASLPAAAASVSSKLSIAVLVGLGAASLLPDRVASTLPAPPVAEAPAPVRPVDLAKPIPVQEPGNAQHQLPQSSSSAEDPAPVSILQVAAQRSRGRRMPQGESGAFGKAGTGTALEKTPVPPADPKAAAPQPDPDVWSDAEIIAALRDCLRRLAPLGAEVEVAMPLKQERCGAPAPVLLKRIGLGPNRVEFQPPPMLNCAMVARLHTWVEKTLQPAAQELLGSPIARIRNASGYACRNRVGTLFHSDRLSEHAMANAIDISGFVTADGQSINVLGKWGPTARELREQQERAAAAAEQAKAAARQAEKEAAEAGRALARAPKGNKRDQAKTEAERTKQEAERKREEANRLEGEWRKSLVRTAELQKFGRGTDAKAIPVTGSKDRGPSRLQRGDKEPNADALGLSPSAAFLRRLHRGACSTFGTVLGPDANEAHRDHFHFDLAARKRSAFCE